MDTLIKPGSKALFLNQLKGLDKDTVGIIDKIYDDWCVIIYHQNKGLNKVYCHSAKLTEVQPIKE